MGWISMVLLLLLELATYLYACYDAYHHSRFQSHHVKSSPIKYKLLIIVFYEFQHAIIIIQLFSWVLSCTVALFVGPEIYPSSLTSTAYTRHRMLFRS